MKKFTWLLPCLLFSLAFSQNQLGLYLSPDVNYRTLYLWTDDEVNSGAAVMRIQNEIQRPIFGMSYGVLYSNTSGPKTVIEGGVGVCTRGYSTKWQTRTTNPNIKDRVKDKFNYIDLPMRLKWYPAGREKKASFFVAPGFTGHFLFRQVSVFYTDAGGDIQKSKQAFAFALSAAFRIVSVSVAAGAGVDLKLSDSSWLTLNPEFRYHISSLGSSASNNTPVDIRTFWYSAGLRTSLVFDLGG